MQRRRALVQAAFAVFIADPLPHVAVVAAQLHAVGADGGRARHLGDVQELHVAFVLPAAPHEVSLAAEFEHGSVDGPAVVGLADDVVAGVHHAAVDVLALRVGGDRFEHAHAVVGVSAVAGGVVDEPLAVEVVQLGGPDLGPVPTAPGRGPHGAADARPQHRMAFADFQAAVSAHAHGEVVRAVADGPGVGAGTKLVRQLRFEIPRDASASVRVGRRECPRSREESHWIVLTALPAAQPVLRTQFARADYVRYRLIAAPALPFRPFDSRSPATLPIRHPLDRRNPLPSVDTAIIDGTGFDFG